MDGFEFKKYVIECKRVGLDNNQIAEKLGMDPIKFEDECRFAFCEYNQTEPDLNKRVESEKPIVHEPAKVTPAKPMNDFIKETSDTPKVGQVHSGVFEVPQN